METAEPGRVRTIVRSRRTVSAPTLRWMGNEMGKAFYEYNDSYMVPFWSDEESDPM